MTILEYLHLDPGLTTEQYVADLAARSRLNCLPDGLPADERTIRLELSALATAELVTCNGGCWEVVEERMPVVSQAELF